jgi:Dual specificity phosphatase, catalytic domain
VNNPIRNLKSDFTVTQLLFNGATLSELLPNFFTLRTIKSLQRQIAFLFSDIAAAWYHGLCRKYSFIAMADNKPSKILGYLYLGGKQDAKAKSLLQTLKIRYILNVTPPRSMDPESGCPSFFEKEGSFVYKRIPVFDNRGEDLLQYMEQSYRFIEEGKHYGGVLVHCHKGISRSSSFVIGYLMKKNGMSLDEALEYVKSIRPIVMPNLAFIAQLKAYEISLAKDRENVIECLENSTTNRPVLEGTAPREIAVEIGPSMGPTPNPSAAGTHDTLDDTIDCAELVGPSIGPSTPSEGPAVDSIEETVVDGETSYIGFISPPIGPSVGPSPVREGSQKHSLSDISPSENRIVVKNVIGEAEVSNSPRAKKTKRNGLN